MNPEAILIGDEHASVNDARLHRLCSFVGIECRTVSVKALGRELDRVADGSLCLLATAEMLSRASAESPNRSDFLDKILRKATFLFVYGFSPENAAVSLARELSGGEISGIRRFDDSTLKYDVTSTQPELTKEFSGLSFGPLESRTDFGFIGNSPGSLQSLISIAGFPLWAVAQQKACSIFLLACSEVADLQERVAGTNLEARTYFSRLVPAIMFLRTVFEDACWHSDRRFANFIIDDPLLQHSYGYLNYEELLRHMQENNFATTLAFIPWNYKRTHQRTAHLFNNHPDRLSLCIHGCDHTPAEFGDSDLASLHQKAALALARMDLHRSWTGLEHAQVMVFPQGLFSSKALSVLRHHGYLAAVNTWSTPSDGQSAPSLTTEELLQPAITRFGGVPLYLRRYPGPLESFAFDQFFHKPVLAVEHHSYLQDTRRVLAFIRSLNSLGGLEWLRLKDIVERTYLQQTLSERTIACRLYGDSQIIDNNHDRDLTFVASRHHAGEKSPDRVLVNDRAVDFVFDGERIRFAREIRAHEWAAVKIVYPTGQPFAKKRYSFPAATRIWGRRALSEFRDNVLCRSESLMSVARTVNRRFLGGRFASLENAGNREGV